MRWILFGLALVLVAQPAEADMAADELVKIFAETCLMRFPDETSIQQYAGGNRLAIMPDEHCRSIDIAATVSGSPARIAAWRAIL